MNTQDYIIKKYNINVGKQYFIDIPEMIGAVDLARLFGELGFKEGLEVGTDEGEYAEVLLKASPRLKLNCVDPWSDEAYEKGFQPESKEPKHYFNNRYGRALKRLEKFGERINIIKTTSMEAIERFDDNALDFVYIDANHDFLNATQDIHYWLKKVRPGGILAGHDYVRYPSHKFNHVQKVVQAYTTSYHLLPVFITTPTNEGMRRDRFKSWFIVKP